jgi:hypothetical protein
MLAEQATVRMTPQEAEQEGDLVPTALPIEENCNPAYGARMRVEVYDMKKDLCL